MINVGKYYHTWILWDWNFKTTNLSKHQNAVYSETCLSKSAFGGKNLWREKPLEVKILTQKLMMKFT